MKDPGRTKAAAGRHPQRLLWLSKEERRSEMNRHCLPQHLLISLMLMKIPQTLKEKQGDARICLIEK
jgi:hypothetical protein